MQLGIKANIYIYIVLYKKVNMNITTTLPNSSLHAQSRNLLKAHFGVEDKNHERLHSKLLDGHGTAFVKHQTHFFLIGTICLVSK